MSREAETGEEEISWGEEEIMANIQENWRPRPGRGTGFGGRGNYYNKPNNFERGFNRIDGRDQDNFDWRSRDGNYRGGSGTNSSGSGGEGTSMGSGRDLDSKVGNFGPGRVGGNRKEFMGELER